MGGGNLVNLRGTGSLRGEVMGNLTNEWAKGRGELLVNRHGTGSLWGEVIHGGI